MNYNVIDSHNDDVVSPVEEGTSVMSSTAPKAQGKPLGLEYWFSIYTLTGVVSSQAQLRLHSSRTRTIRHPYSLDHLAARLRQLYLGVQKRTCLISAKETGLDCDISWYPCILAFLVRLAHPTLLLRISGIAPQVRAHPSVHQLRSSLHIERRSEYR